MNGETDLKLLLKNMKPELHAGEYVFCLIDPSVPIEAADTISTFKEDEGLTVILPKTQADKLGLSYPSVCAWITLTVHSSLEAVGLTAAVSGTLAREGISCNMVAALHHDHIFLPVRDAERAMKILKSLSEQETS